MLLAVWACLWTKTEAWLPRNVPLNARSYRHSMLGRQSSMVGDHSDDDADRGDVVPTVTINLSSSVEEKFKIVTCMSTSCCQKRKKLGLDPLSTFGAMYQRAEGSAIQVEECPCLGSCSLAPCVGIEHDDFLGYVSLEGMNDGEFGAKAFHNIVTDEDADRVWSCVENAVHIMMAEKAEEDL